MRPPACRQRCVRSLACVHYVNVFLQSPTLVPTESPTDAPTNAPTEVGAPSHVLVDQTGIIHASLVTAVVLLQSPTETPTDAPTPAPTLHPCRDGSHDCDTGPGGVCQEDPDSHQWQCGCAPGYECISRCGATLDANPTDAIASAMDGAAQVPHVCQMTNAPTAAPTKSPTESPTLAPTESPTPSPTDAPTDSPTGAPTHTPTPDPTNNPTQNPTASPTNTPTKTPTEVCRPTHACADCAKCMQYHDCC